MAIGICANVDCTRVYLQELDLLHLMLGWVETDPSSRVHHLQDLLHCLHADETLGRLCTLAWHPDLWAALHPNNPATPTQIHPNNSATPTQIHPNKEMLAGLSEGDRADSCADMATSWQSASSLLDLLTPAPGTLVDTATHLYEVNAGASFSAAHAAASFHPENHIKSTPSTPQNVPGNCVQHGQSVRLDGGSAMSLEADSACWGAIAAPAFGSHPEHFKVSGSDGPNTFGILGSAWGQGAGSSGMEDGRGSSSGIVRGESASVRSGDCDVHGEAAPLKARVYAVSQLMAWPGVHDSRCNAGALNPILEFLRFVDCQCC